MILAGLRSITGKLFLMEKQLYFRLVGVLFLISVLSLASSVIFQIHAGYLPSAYRIFDISFYHFVPFLLWLVYLPLLRQASLNFPVQVRAHWTRHLLISLTFAIVSRVLAIWVDFAIKNAVGMTDATPLSVLWDVRWVVLASFPKELLMYWLVMFLFSYFERSAPQKPLEKLMLDTDQGTIFLSPRELLYVESSRNYLIFHTMDRKYKSRKTLKSIIPELEGQFMQIHRSRLINTDAVARIIPWRNGEYMLELQNGLHISSSRSFQSNVRSIGKVHATRPAMA